MIASIRSCSLPTMDDVKGATIVSSKIAVFALAVLSRCYASYLTYSYGKNLLLAGHTVTADFLMAAGVGMLVINLFCTIPQLHEERCPARRSIASMFHQTQNNTHDVFRYVVSMTIAQFGMGVAVGAVGAGSFALADLAKNYFNPSAPGNLVRCYG